MKRLIVLFALAACALGVAQARPGPWGPAGCSAVAEVALQQVQPGYKWWTHEGEPNFVFLYWGNQISGCYSYKSGFYRHRTASGWGNPAKAPIPPPLTGLAGGPAGHVFGAAIDQVHKEESFSHNGIETSRKEVEQAIGANLRDDSKAGHVTYIDADPARRKAAAELLARTVAEKGMAEKVRVQVYDPTKKQSQAMLEPNQLERDTKFKATGHVLLAQAAARPGQEAVQATTNYDGVTAESVIEALRKAVPDWVPDKPSLPSLPSLPSIPWEYIGLGLAGLCLGIVALRHHN